MQLDRLIAVSNSKAVYRNGTRCIKVFNHQFSKADVLQEALNHALIEATGLLLPNLQNVTIFDGKWVIVTDYIPGKTFARLMEEEPENFDTYLKEFVRLHRCIHDASNTMLRSLKDKIRAGLQSSGLAPATIFSLQHRLEAMPDGNTICHGDFDFSDVILAENGNAYLLDWDAAARGDAAADIAGTWLLLQMQGREETARAYLDAICENEEELAQVKKWIPFAAAAKLEHCNEEQREKLLQWIV